MTRPRSFLATSVFRVTSGISRLMNGPTYSQFRSSVDFIRAASLPTSISEAHECARNIRGWKIGR